MRHLRVSKDTDKEELFNRYYPETIEDSSGIDYNFVLHNRDFNKRPNTKD